MLNKVVYDEQYLRVHCAGVKKIDIHIIVCNQNMRHLMTW